MPGLIAVAEFVDETREDYNSPTTSTFVSRMPQCRQTITSLEEVSCIVVINHPLSISSYFLSPFTISRNYDDLRYEMESL